MSIVIPRTTLNTLQPCCGAIPFVVATNSYRAHRARRELDSRRQVILAKRRAVAFVAMKLHARALRARRTHHLATLNDAFLSRRQDLASMWPRLESAPRATVFLPSLDYSKQARAVLRGEAREHEVSTLLEVVSALARSKVDRVVLVASSVEERDSLIHLLSACARCVMLCKYRQSITREGIF